MVVTNIPGAYYYGNFNALTNADMDLLIKLIDDQLSLSPNNKIEDNDGEL